MPIPSCRLTSAALGAVRHSVKGRRVSLGTSVFFSFHALVLFAPGTEAKLLCAPEKYPMCCGRKILLYINSSLVKIKKKYIK